ncbi:diguanylate cyclase, partial [Burkholderia gladioli]|nr:diguanylate cyclase [Burkholderia gladioli]
TVFLDAMHHSEGAVAGLASLDGTRRLYVYKRLPTLPIIVDVAPAERDIYLEWRHRAERLGAIVLVFSLVVAAGSVLLAHELRRRQRAEEQLRRLVRTDALTGLGNRRSFDTTLHVEWLRTQRTGRPLSLLFVDIDQFKAYNDHYGHPAGDEVLREVGRVLTRCAQRPSDEVARYGGEEFVVTLPDTDARGAAQFGERVRRTIYDLAIPHAASHYGRVTVSIGIVTSGEAAASSDVAFVNLADTALYHAKTAGRNRICDPQGVVLA